MALSTCEVRDENIICIRPASGRQRSGALSASGSWCGHAPELEIDLALANIGLDLLGQARNFLTYAAELEGQGDEDTLAFGRDERQFRNVLLVEQPNGNFADTLVRQYLMDEWNVALYERLIHSSDRQIAAIAAKAIKEARYHLRFSRGWLVRLVTAQKYPHKNAAGGQQSVALYR